MEGVEPTRLAALDPKSSASANFATSASQSKLESYLGFFPAERKSRGFDNKIQSVFPTIPKFF